MVVPPLIRAKQFFFRHQILVVNFFAPWCYWSNRLVLLS
jgi:hypothetical protein